MKKFCVKCGKPFDAIGREVICPSCKAQAAEDAKKAAVLKAKRASWAGESVPVRISGRASTVIREYAAANGMAFAESLDALLKMSTFFQNTGKAWEDVTPYKSHRRDKATSTGQDKQDGTQATSKQATSKQASKPQDVQAAQEVKQEEVKTAAGKTQEAPQEVTKAAKVANKNTTSTAAKKAVKTTAGKKA